MAKIVMDKIKINELLTRGVEEVIDFNHLKEKILGGNKLRIKLGIDPTSNVLHLGHSIPLRKLKQFQDLGHQIIFLIGDFTAKIGDPSGRVASRPSLSDKQIKENMKSYAKQASMILDMKKVEVRHNSEWYGKKKADFMMKLASMFTYGQLKARREFRDRMEKGIDITLEEILYPLLQGYDSVELKADVEIGGTDQKFNLTMARRVQKKFKLPKQDIMTLSLLEGIDGERKMSKSYNNYIALNESSEQMFAKIMAIPDSLIWRYFNLLTDISLEEIEKMKKDQIALIGINNIKEILAFEITKIYHGEKGAGSAREEFNKVFRQGELPQKISEVRIDGETLNIIDLVLKTGLVPSSSEAKRLISQNAVKVGEEIISDWRRVIKIENGLIIKIGPRKFIKIKK